MCGTGMQSDECECRDDASEKKRKWKLMLDSGCSPHLTGNIIRRIESVARLRATTHNF